MDENLLRQRRNLIAISVALLLFDFADVSIARVGLLGTDLVVGDPRMLMVFAWAIWAYFLARYYQYWHAHTSNALSGMYRDYWRGFAVKDLREHEIVGDPELIRSGALSWNVKFLRRDAEKNRLSNAVIGVSAPRVFYWSVLSTLATVFRSKNFTDYALPFLLAFAAAAVSLYQRGFTNFLG